ncbi:MAG: hypothetical protein DHS20C11_19430 [Lysobacteraceae bacterium]|nr:MAG: hypothetical protein DHS20C11_19430 [Xanthomonadaceae bacterium]
MKATWNGVTIAESDDTVVVEGNHYFPESSLHTQYLVESDHTSFCPWKGTAHYHSLVVGGATNINCVWHYPAPKSAAIQIKGRVAFWRGVEITD